MLLEQLAEGVLVVNGVGVKALEPFQCHFAHEEREVGAHDVMVAVDSADGRAAHAEPCSRVRLAVVLLDVIGFEVGGAPSGMNSGGKCREAVAVV